MIFLSDGKIGLFRSVLFLCTKAEEMSNIQGANYVDNAAVVNSERPSAKGKGCGRCD